MPEKRVGAGSSQSFLHWVALTECLCLTGCRARCIDEGGGLWTGELLPVLKSSK